jgi:hypothetical protein
MPVRLLRRDARARQRKAKVRQASAKVPTSGGAEADDGFEAAVGRGAKLDRATLLLDRRWTIARPSPVPSPAQPPEAVERALALLDTARSEVAHGAQVSMFHVEPTPEQAVADEGPEQPHEEREPPEAANDAAAPLALA